MAPTGLKWSSIDKVLIFAIRQTLFRGAMRLCAHYSKLARSGKPANVVIAAIARELAGFVWAIARRVPPAAG